MTTLSGCAYGCVPCTCQTSTQTSCTSWPCAWKFTSPFDGITYILREQGVDAWLDKTGKWSLIYNAAPPVSYTLSDGTNQYLMSGPRQDCCSAMTLTNIAGNPIPASITVSPVDCGCAVKVVCQNCSITIQYRASTCHGDGQLPVGTTLPDCQASADGQVCVCVTGTQNLDTNNDPKLTECDPATPDNVFLPGSVSDNWTLQQVLVGTNDHGIKVYWADLYKNGVKVLRYINQFHSDVAISSITNLCSCTLTITITSSTGALAFQGNVISMVGNGTVSVSVNDPCNALQNPGVLINGQTPPITATDGQQLTIRVNGKANLCCQSQPPQCAMGASHSAPTLAMPTLLARAKSLTAALLAHAGDSFGKTTPRERARRRSICQRCPLFRARDNVCMKCGCKGGGMLLDMWAMRSKHCPDDPSKW